MGELLNQIKAMDKKSEEFFDLYRTVTDKYFDFDDPDEYQKAGAYLNLIINGGEPWLLCLLVKLAAQLIGVVEEKRPASHGTFHVNNTEVFFDFYTDKKQLGKMHTMLKEAVLGTAKVGDPQ